MKTPSQPEPSARPQDGSQSGEPHFLTLGRVVRPHGIRGEVRVVVPVGSPPRLQDVRYLYLGPDLQRCEIESYRMHRGALLLKLAGIPDRTAAEALRGQLLYISIEDAEPLGPDEYYVRQLLGLRVVTEAGELLGELVEVIVTGANDVYRVQHEGEELLLPAIGEVIREVDLAAGEIRVHLLPGLRGD